MVGPAQESEKGGCGRGWAGPKEEGEGGKRALDFFPPFLQNHFKAKKKYFSTK